MFDRDVSLYIPHGGWVRAELMVSAIRCLTDPAGVVAELHDVACGPVMGMARNAIAAEFLAGPYPWLLMTDADTIYTADTVRLLREAADPDTCPVIGALCWTLSATGKYPTVYRADKTAAGEVGFTSLEHLPDGDDLLEVDATGAACLMIHRSAFERMTDHDKANDQLWFAELAVDNRQFGEDFSFCIRAKAAGIPVHVRTGARTGHVKPVIIGEVPL
jgi:hypothetical protein